MNLRIKLTSPPTILFQPHGGRWMPYSVKTHGVLNHAPADAHEFQIPNPRPKTPDPGLSRLADAFANAKPLR
jgi:hypothetical protein